MEAPEVKIVWTRRASKHLRAAFDYWAKKKSAASAQTMLERIFCTVEILEEFPETGRQGRVPGTRELAVVPTPFVIAYRVRPRRIEMLALLHGSRKWPDNL